MSMKNYLNENNAVNSIRLQLRHPSGTCKIWVIVEGETDQRLFSKLINGDHVKIEISYGGLTGVLRVVSELSKETDRVLGIRDADFLHLEGKTETADNIFLTDFHDVEMMLISCDTACHLVVAEYISSEKSPDFLRKKLLQSIAFIGGLRWINDSNSLGLNFEGLGLGDYYNGETLLLDEMSYLQVTMKRSPGKKKGVSREEVINKIENISDLLNLCNGHDFHRAFALCVNSILYKLTNCDSLNV